MRISCSLHQGSERSGVVDDGEEGLLTIGLGQGKLRTRRTGFKPYKRCSVEAKETRVASLSPLLERAKIRFIRGHSDQEKLIEQLLYFPSRTLHDDGPDALAGAVALVQTIPGGKTETYQQVETRAFGGRGAY